VLKFQRSPAILFGRENKTVLLDYDLGSKPVLISSTGFGS
jgi:hypothetical protein